MEETKQYKDCNEQQQQIVITLFSQKLDSDKNIITKCFNLSNPVITFIHENDKIKQMRVEEEGSEALKVVLREYVK